MRGTPTLRPALLAFHLVHYLSLNEGGFSKNAIITGREPESLSLPRTNFLTRTGLMLSGALPAPPSSPRMRMRTHLLCTLLLVFFSSLPTSMKADHVGFGFSSYSSSLLIKILAQCSVDCKYSVICFNSTLTSLRKISSHPSLKRNEQKI